MDIHSHQESILEKEIKYYRERIDLLESKIDCLEEEVQRENKKSKRFANLTTIVIIIMFFIFLSPLLSKCH